MAAANKGIWFNPEITNINAAAKNPGKELYIKKG